MTVLASDGDVLASSSGVLSSGYDGGFIMSLASGTRVYLAYQEETTARGTPEVTPDMKMLRATGRSINLQKNTIRSAEVRSDRQQAGLRHGFNQVVGSPGFELSLTAFDDLIAGAMSGTWAAVTTGTATVSVVVGAPTTTADFATSSNWLTDGFEVGMIVTPTGLTGGNLQQSRITSMAASGTTITVESVDGTTAYADETGAGAETVAADGQVIKIGTTLRTFTIERGFDDVSQYQLFNGCAINQMSMQIQPEQMVGGNFDILGMSANAMAASPRDATITAAATNDPMSAFEGQLSEGGSASSVVTGVNFTLNNNRSLQAVVGTKFSPDVFEGTAAITGEATVFFEDEVLFNKFVDETISSLSVQMDDLNLSDFIVVGFPAIKYTGGDMDPPQQGPVPITMPFEAQVAALTGTSMYIQKSNT